MFTFILNPVLFQESDDEKIEINNIKSEISNKNLILDNQPDCQNKGSLHKGNPIVAHYVHKVGTVDHGNCQSSSGIWLIVLRLLEKAR